jgi:hypothetical protein
VENGAEIRKIQTDGWAQDIKESEKNIYNK